MINQILKQKRTTLNICDLTTFERKLASKFPEEFREFLIQFNGGSPIKSTIRFNGANLKIKGATINYFFGFGGSSENIEKSYSNLKYDLPDMLIPFANTPDGNYFLMSLKNDSSFGKIYYYDHEFEYDSDEEFNEKKGIYPTCLSKVAESFGELLEHMIEL
ncbi:hypothetical protein OLMES_0120 [Oleiphilus messinensis]|uniref:Knr4/Smi1-like domain-containing protein n=1 Tax=Oleiphilus messinensis TaxID=141451 RepID=A0A1Y0I192_9GAMM|nr:SMI1/KNR4 family protein [Oleiphilus messinensis]ARU54228.1 hypothetical protein OLMES_0120 [Oleiphilus messinensis]